MLGKCWAGAGRAGQVLGQVLGRCWSRYGRSYCVASSSWWQIGSIRGNVARVGRRRGTHPHCTAHQRSCLRPRASPMLPRVQLLDSGPSSSELITWDGAKLGVGGGMASPRDGTVPSGRNQRQSCSNQRQTAAFGSSISGNNQVRHGAIRLLHIGTSREQRILHAPRSSLRRRLATVH